MFKSINKIGGYIKVSRYTKIHLALKKFQPPWTHKAIQAWMHPFWLKKISSVLCWGTGTGCAKPIFDTQIISNRKYWNPLFPLTMLWFRETETQWWKNRYVVVNTNESHWFQATPPLVSTDGWGTSTDTSDCQNSGSIKEVLGGWFFPLSIRVWFKVCRIEQKDCSRLLELGSSKFHAMSESPGSDGQSLPWGCALGVPPSVQAHGDTHPANCLCSYCKRGGKENLTKAKNWEKRRKSGCLNLALYRTTLGLGWSPLQTLWVGLLILFLLLWSWWIYSSKSISSIMPMIL